ncbi:hypothetical protein Tco_0452045 [Tanacetum coccineum]
MPPDLAACSYYSLPQWRRFIYIQEIFNFVPKVSQFDVFWNANPIPLITEAIQQSSYYPLVFYGNGVAGENKEHPLREKKGKATFKLVDEDDEAQQESIPQEEGPLPTTRKLQLSPHLSLKSLHSLALTAKSVKMEQEMSEVKKTDHSADVLASIKSQVPTVVDKYLGIKLDDALLKILEQHTADLIEKYSVLYWPESVKNQIEKRVRQENYQSQKGTR